MISAEPDLSGPLLPKTAVSEEGSNKEYVSISEDKSAHDGNGDDLSVKAEQTADHSPEKSKPRCLVNCSYKISKSKFLKASNRVKMFWQKMMLLYASLNDELRFPIFKEKAGELNHLSAKLWIATYAIQETTDVLLDEDLKSLSELFVKAVKESYVTGISVQALHDPLKEFFKAGRLSIDELNSTMSINVAASPTKLENADNKSDIWNNSSILAVQESLLVGNRIYNENSFFRLKIYTRTAAKRKWFSFAGLPKLQRISIIKDSLTGLDDSFAKVRKLLSQIVLALKHGGKSAMGDSLLKHLRVMTKQLGKMKFYKERLSLDENDILTELRRTEAYFQGIVETSLKLIRQISEVIVMTRLCYSYLVGELNLGFTVWEVVSQNFAGDQYPGIKEFETDDFQKAKYPDILRKVPVVSNRVELSLHKQMEFSAPLSPRNTLLSMDDMYHVET